ncbi:MAG: LCP family protein [Anaerolineae bacterium]
MTYRQFALFCLFVLINEIIYSSVVVLLVDELWPIATPIPQAEIVMVSSHPPQSPPSVMVAMAPTTSGNPATPTTTPLPSPTPTPTATPSFTPTITPTITPTPTSTPTPAFPAETINVVLLGIDRRSEKATWRTDSMIVASINRPAKTVGLLSIPRDLWVSISGHGQGRINTADYLGERTGYEGGGSALVKKTIEDNLGIPVHYYVRVDFQGFVNIVDTLGGVTVDVDCAVNDWFLDSTSSTGYTLLKLPVGIYHMDGKTALMYSRSRRGGSDFDRIRRQQKVLRGLWEGLMKPDILPKIPQLVAMLSDSFQTDLGLNEILSLAYLGVQLEPYRIRSRFIDRSMVSGWTTPEGAQVLLPNQERINQAVAEFLTMPGNEGERLAEEGAQIFVWNGTTSPHLVEVVATRLTREGFQVAGTGPADRLDYATTIIIDYTGKQYTLEVLSRTLGVKQANVRPYQDPASPIDIGVILGRDFKACSY